MASAMLSRSSVHATASLCRDSTQVLRAHNPALGGLKMRNTLPKQASRYPGMIVSATPDTDNTPLPGTKVEPEKKDDPLRVFESSPVEKFYRPENERRARGRQHQHEQPDEVRRPGARDDQQPPGDAGHHVGVRGGGSDGAERGGAGDGGAWPGVVPVRGARLHRRVADPHVQQGVPRQPTQRPLQRQGGAVEWPSSHAGAGRVANHREHLPEGPPLGLRPQLAQLLDDSAQWRAYSNLSTKSDRLL